VPPQRDHEGRIGRILDGLPGRRSGDQDEPIDLAVLVLERARGSLIEGPAGPIVANEYTITLGGEPADDATVQGVARDLETVVTGTAAQEGWRLEGPARVTFVFRPSGDPEIDSVVAPGPMSPWAVFDRVVESHRAEIGHNRCIVGRSYSADVLLDDDTISRRHALVVRQAGAAWIADLGSSNGTYLNGAPVREPTEIVDGDVIGFGDISYTFRLLA
jgi:hypothetical protein